MCRVRYVSLLNALCILPSLAILVGHADHFLLQLLHNGYQPDDTVANMPISEVSSEKLRSEEPKQTKEKAISKSMVIKHNSPNLAYLIANSGGYCIQGRNKFIKPYLDVLLQSDLGANYEGSKIMSGSCADGSFTKYGKPNGCYKKRLTLWFQPGEQGELELHDNHWAQADQIASSQWVASHTMDEWEDMMQIYNPCNNSYPWDRA